MPSPGFSGNTRFNWLQQETAQARIHMPGARAIDIGGFDFKHPGTLHFDRDIEPALGITETSTEITGFMQYRVDRFSMSLMERFTRNYLRFVEVLLRSPETNVMSIVIE